MCRRRPPGGVGVECLPPLILDRVAGRADEGIIAAVARRETRHGLVVAAGMPGRGLKLSVGWNASRISMTFSLRFTRAFLGIDCMDTADSSPGGASSGDFGGDPMAAGGELLAVSGDFRFCLRELFMTADSLGQELKSYTDWKRCTHAFRQQKPS